MDTRFYKNRDGHTAKTNIETPEVGEDMNLSIHTYKDYNGQLLSHASVHLLEKRGGYSTMTHRVFHDYSMPVIREKARVTEKAVRDQHARAIEYLPIIMQEVRKHYAALPEKVR
jgi:hypothetical protein